jgi:hypothetical protein
MIHAFVLIVTVSGIAEGDEFVFREILQCQELAKILDKKFTRVEAHCIPIMVPEGANFYK